MFNIPENNQTFNVQCSLYLYMRITRHFEPNPAVVSTANIFVSQRFQYHWHIASFDSHFGGDESLIFFVIEVDSKSVHTLMSWDLDTYPVIFVT